MFIRIVKDKNKDGSVREYVRIIKAVREGKRSKHVVVAHLGRLDILQQTGQLDNLIDGLKKYSERSDIINLAKDITAESSKDYGVLPLYRKLWESFGIEKYLNQYLRLYETGKDLTEAIFSMVVNRLMNPSSKLGTFNWRETVYEPRWDELDLQDYYRALDFMVGHKQSLEQDLFQEKRDLFNQKLDLVMFDTTTIKYWGEGADDEELLKHGYSKDKRGDLKQIIVGVLMTKEGRPIGHEVYSGNSSERTIFAGIVRGIKERYQIDTVVLVCDRGMISRANIEAMEAEGLQYIIGVRMRQMSQDEQKELLCLDGFQQNGNLKVKELSWQKLAQKIAASHEKTQDLAMELLTEDQKQIQERLHRRRYIVCYNPEEAIAQSNAREYFQKIIQNKVDTNTIKDWIVKNGYKKYLKIENAEVSLNEDKLSRESIFDGKWILLTNTSFSSHEVSSYYKGLWQIEQGFRELKSELEAGPIFHWKERRIRAHVMVCFLALVLKIELKKKLKVLNPELNFSKVMADVEKLKVIELKINGKQVLLRTELQGQAYSAFQAAGTSPPSRIIQIQETKQNVVTVPAPNSIFSAS